MYMLIIQYCCTGGCIKHETNGTLQACSILRPYYTVNSAANRCTSATVAMFLWLCCKWCSYTQGVIRYGLGKHQKVHFKGCTGVLTGCI